VRDSNFKEKSALSEEISTKHARTIKIETWISVCASITAVAALVVSAVQSWENHKHNRLSLKPMLFISDEITKDNSVREVAIDNFGIGPARITEFQLIVDGKPVHSASGLDEWDIAEKELGLNLPGLHYEINALDGDTSVMRVDEHLRIIGMDEGDYDRLTPELRDQWSKAIKRLSVEVKFRSVYDELDSVHYPKVR